MLIDSPSPSTPPLLSDTLIDRLLLGQEHAVDSSMTALVVRQFKQNTTLLDQYVPRARRDAAIPLAFLRCTAGFCPDGVEGVPAWFRERDQDTGRIVGPWEALVGRPVPVWDVPGHHFEPFSRVHVRNRFSGCSLLIALT